MMDQDARLLCDSALLHSIFTFTFTAQIMNILVSGVCNVVVRNTFYAENLLLLESYVRSDNVVCGGMNCINHLTIEILAPWFYCTSLTFLCTIIYVQTFFTSAFSLTNRLRLCIQYLLIVNPA